jgi:hypothetical protein
MDTFWQGVAACCAVLTVIGGAHAFHLRFIRLMVRDELTSFLAKADQTYVRNDVHEEHERAIDHRLSNLEVVRGR